MRFQDKLTEEGFHHDCGTVGLRLPAVLSRAPGVIRSRRSPPNGLDNSAILSLHETVVDGWKRWNGNV